jgi:hypothetical protein
MHTLLTRAFQADLEHADPGLTGLNVAPGINSVPEYMEYISGDIERLYSLLGLTDESPHDLSSFLFQRPRPVLATKRLNCRFCPPQHRNLVPSLRRRKKNGNQPVWLLDASFQWVSADLLVGHCANCNTDYYPDRITRVGEGRHRAELLEYDTEFIRVSKNGVWVHRKVAVAQEKALHRFHSGWSNFADWINDSTDNDINVTFTYRQSQRLFLEHFARRLLVAHGKEDSFACEAHTNSKVLAEKVREMIGVNGGVIPGSLGHGCMDCTHVKRYRSDLVQEGAILTDDAEVADSEAGPAEAVS